jgi:hypothetical protein
MAKRVLVSGIDQAVPLSEEHKRKALRALERLAALREGLPLVDAVEVIRSVRDDAFPREPLAASVN